MGGFITVAARSRDGVISSALFYTNHLAEFLLDADFVQGEQGSALARIEEMRVCPDYGPYPVAPFAYGMRFIDFQSRTIFDSQAHCDPQGLEYDDMIASLIADDGRFEKIVPYIDGKTYWERSGRGGLDVKSQEIQPAKTVDDLWEKLGFAGLPSKFDFATLRVALPGWRVVRFKPDLHGSEVLRVQLSKIGVVGRADGDAWDEYLDVRRSEARRNPF